MKVLFVSAFSSKETGSYHQRLFNLKEGLAGFGVDTGMLYLGDYFVQSPYILKALDIPLILKKLERYDVIHAGASSACYVAGLAKEFGNFSLVQDVHGCVEELLLQEGAFIIGRDISYLQGVLLENISNLTSDLFITCSRPLKERLLQRGYDKQLIEVIRNGVDTELFKPRGFPSNSPKFVVTYAGSFQKWQGIENFFEAAKLISDPNVKFRVIGFKKEDTQLKNRFDQELMGRVELIDSLSQTELIDQLNSSDVLVIPRNKNIATQMAFPTKFAEYLAVGKPVIVTEVDETAGFVRKSKCGFVCDPSPTSIADAIMTAKRSSESALLRMGKNGRQLAESMFDRRLIAETYFDFLQSRLRRIGFIAN